MSTHKRYKPQNTPQKPQAANVELVMIPTAPRRDGFSAGQWRKAMKLAESVEYPSRTLLYDLYNDILLDTHLESVIGKRRDNIEGTKFTFNTGTSTRSEKIDKLIGMPWFTTMCADLLDARFFGHTLSWVDLSGGVFHKYEMLRRKHVIPEKHVHLLRQSDRTGIDYTLPPYSNYIIEAGERDDFGLLLKVAIWVLFKRGDISDWATFNEMFSMPFRLGKYPQYDNEAKKALGKRAGIPPRNLGPLFPTPRSCRSLKTKCPVIRLLTANSGSSATNRCPRPLSATP